MLVVAVLAFVVFWIVQHQHRPTRGQGQETTRTSPTPAAPKLDSGVTYLPAPGLRLTYHEKYVDGDAGDWELVTAHLGNRVQLTSVECLNGYNTAGDDDLATVHYLIKADNIWKVLDIRPADRELFLPLHVSPGTTFSSTGVKGKVVAIGKSCDLGFTKLSNCLVVNRNYVAVGYEETQYYAPGYGIVLTKTGNTTMRKLTGFTRMDATETTAFAQKHTTWQEALVKQ